MLKTDPRLLADVRSLSRQSFEERYDHPFLGVTVVTIEDEEAAFQTLVHELEPTDLDPGARGEDVMLAPVKKREGANGFSFITVGRAGNNDIIIAASAVSKCHAMLQRTGDNYMVIDAESRNGTTLNGATLAPKVPHPIVDGDVILLARGISAVFLEPGPAYLWLRRAGV